ncbi:MAG: hypothetical protein DWQ29_19765 [Planctomycetota bacterium]|nr:MAG: hypothetical protein DWQ29_19765 [Planctomycetota bacterium]
MIVVVLSLLAALTFLGIFFFSWSDQARKSAERFNDAGDLEVDPDPVLDHGLQQFLVSTPAQYTDSALFGNRWTLLAHVVGHVNINGIPSDVNPHSGSGITIRYVDNVDNSTGLAPPDGIPDINLDISSPPDGTNDVAGFSLDYDGVLSTTNPDQDNFILNLSATANGGSTYDFSTDPLGIGALETDAGYTYPDVNCLPLAYEAVLPTTPPRRVLIPSYFRPQLFPRKRANGFGDLYTDANTRRQVFRPHFEHRYFVNEDLDNDTNLDPGEDFNQNGTLDTSLTPQRYLFTGGIGTAARSGDRNRIIADFDFGAGTAGIFSGPGQPEQYDVDADGDGILDSIWLDLDHPIINLADGRQAVPLYYVKIVDADALLNLNAHGSADLLFNPNYTNGLSHPLGSALPMTMSNLGLSVSEVNPGWALAAQPQNPDHLNASYLSYALGSHGAQFGFDPVTYFTGGADTTEKTMTSSNMELLRILVGGPQTGRWGEPGLLDFSTSSIPLPGTTGADDDLDAIASIGPNANPYGGYPYSDADLQNLVVPPFVHPLDYRGFGLYLDRNSGSAPNGAERYLANNPIANNPSTWPEYDANWQNQESGGGPIHGVETYRTAIASALQPGAVNGLTDEGDEIILESNFPLQAEDDAPFDPAENEFLHFSDAAFQLSGGQSRLAELASFNLRDSLVARDIRKQFTTESWDRREFSATPVVAQNSGADRSVWEYTSWAVGTGDFETPPGVEAFPPEFYDGTPDTRAGQRYDPFRPEVRLLLKSEDSTNDNIGANRRAARLRLNLNRILSDDNAPYDGYGAFDANANPQFRNLVPHPDFPGSGAGSTVPAMVHDNGAATPYAFNAIASDPVAQEWWARYDRQRLARDIYVLLYTLAGRDNLDILNDAYSEEQDSDGIPDRLREFAQFAVNYVDALDRDNVITRFEYDIDLRNGWDTPNQVVNGVEAQQLTFSEVLWVQTERLPAGMNNTDTFWDDEDNERNFLYIELRNATPFTVPLDDDTWRIIRQPVGSPTAPSDAELEFLDPASDIGPGENFVVAMHDDTVVVPQGTNMGQRRSSTLYVDFDSDGLFNAVVPYSQLDSDMTLPTDEQNDHPPIMADLDVSYSDAGGADHQGHFNLTIRRDSGTGDPVGTLVQVNESAVPFDVVLQRRRTLHGHGDIAQSDDDWIEVDRMTVDPVRFQTSSGLSTAVQNTESTEWDEPFTPRHTSGRTPTIGVTYSDGTSYPGRAHTIGYPSAVGRHAANSELRRTGESFSVWQPHFDRDFSSVYELLSIPLYGHREQSSALPWVYLNQGGPAWNLAEAGTPPTMTGHTAASARFLLPQGFDDGSGNTIGVNRFYRLLEFVEIPSRSHQEIQDRMALLRRTPGHINLNTLRHDPVLAGLIDDPQIRRFGTGSGDLPDFVNTFPSDDGYDAGRNWFQQLLVARDGLDVFSNLPLPGVPGSHPFRGMGYINPNSPDHSLRDTILRPHLQAGALNSLQLFEARGTADVGTDNVDFHTRNRLLCKIANNSTNRSHVFFMWVGFEFFEAHQPDAVNFPNVVQIGARIEDISGHRDFLVIDMSRLEEAYIDTDPTDAVPGRFDWRKFVIHRKRLP